VTTTSSRGDWNIGRGRTVSLEPWCLMGILNATPDSFSDGGEHLDPADAVAAGADMVAAGAGILDVGGESTRPGAASIDVETQIARVVPVIERLRATPATADIVISIDTTRAAVAAAAIDAGADLVNDVSGGCDDPEILAVAADRGVGIVLMHRLRAPAADSYSDRYVRPPEYADVVDEVRARLSEFAMRAEAAGVPADRIAVDPGLGFGKSVEQNLELIRRLGEIVADGRPVLVGASRKSFLGAVTGVTDPGSRTLESVIAGVESWRAGAAILRVHDVEPHRRGLETAVACRVGLGRRPAPAS
jgi:dihydropteroate synthase